MVSAPLNDVGNSTGLGRAMNELSMSLLDEEARSSASAGAAEPPAPWRGLSTRRLRPACPRPPHHVDCAVRRRRKAVQPIRRPSSCEKTCSLRAASSASSVSSKTSSASCPRSDRRAAMRPDPSARNITLLRQLPSWRTATKVALCLPRPRLSRSCKGWRRAHEVVVARRIRKVVERA